MATKKRKLSAGVLIVKVLEILRKRLTDYDGSAMLVGSENKQRDLAELLGRTVDVGESNSVIIIGPRGCGKTLLLNKVLNDLLKSESCANVHQVSLNGLLQTDDRIAIKEITRQLQLENAVGDRVFGSFAENLTFLLEALKSGNEQTEAIIFILDEFDLFCGHHNQTLLYNLLDVTQSVKTPISVVGLTCRLDVLELLEKRVKSRFSHRIIHMFTDFTFEQYIKLVASLLDVPADVIGKECAEAWKMNIKELCKNATVLDTLKRIFNHTKDVRTLKSFLFLVVCQLDSSRPHLCVQDFEQAYEHSSYDTKSLMLDGMSVLELCLIVAMRRLVKVYDGEPFNFEMVYKEYLKLASRRSSILYDKDIVMKAFDHLIFLELVRPVERMASCIQIRFQLVTLLLESSQVENVLQMKDLPTDIKQWASSQVD